MRCCGQDCPRAGIGRNNGARVSTRSNARRGKQAPERPSRLARAGGVSGACLVFACVAADKTVRAPGLAAITERGFQPAATPEGASRRPKRPSARPRVLVGCRSPVGFACVAADKTVRAPGLAGITERGFQPAATPEGARRRPKGQARVRACWWAFGRLLGVRALLRTRLSARRDWPQ